jgi:hypothetical protein
MEDLRFLCPVSIAGKMRVGPARDGGYVVYKPSLYNSDVLISYGVGWDIDFELDYCNLTGNRVYMYDPTMFDKGYINGPYCRRPAKKFYKYLLFSYNSYKWKKKMKCLQRRGLWFYNEGLATEKKDKYDIFANHLLNLNIKTKKILLKMDIEGNEYPILSDDNFLKSLHHVDQLILEFHDLKNKLRELENVIRRLKEEYELVHIHGNNFGQWFTLYRNTSDIVFPDVVEITLVRKESLLAEDILDLPADYPCRDLDYPNTSLNPDFKRLVFE